jgi:aspartate racemase
MISKKRIGIIGGMGTQAGANLFQKLIDLSPANNDQGFMEVFLHSNSQIPDRTRAIVYGEESPLKEMIRSIDLMNKSGVELLLLACNTIYHYYDEFVTYADAIVLNPIHLLREYVVEKGFKKIGILGTTGTMAANMFDNELRQYDKEIIKLDSWEQENLFMESVYGKNGLKSSTISQETIDKMHNAVRLLIDRGAEIIVGGCSEISIAVQQSDIPIPYIDTMDLMAQKAIEECYYKEKVLNYNQ